MRIEIDGPGIIHICQGDLEFFAIRNLAQQRPSAYVAHWLVSQSDADGMRIPWLSALGMQRIQAPFPPSAALAGGHSSALTSMVGYVTFAYFAHEVRSCRHGLPRPLTPDLRRFLFVVVESTFV